MKFKYLILAALAAVVLVGGFQQAAFAKKGGDSKVRIILSASAAYPNAKGKATYKAKPGEREFQVEAEHLKPLKGKTVRVLVNGVRVGSATVNALGEARLNLNSETGAAVPAIKAGDSVRVETNAGVLIVSGKF